MCDVNLEQIQIRFVSAFLYCKVNLLYAISFTDNICLPFAKDSVINNSQNETVCHYMYLTTAIKKEA